MDSFNDVMDAVKAYCKGRVSDASYRVFIQDLNLLNFEGTNIIILEVPNDVVMRFAAARYADLLKEAFASILGFEVELKFVLAAPAPDGGISRAKVTKILEAEAGRERPAQRAVRVHVRELHQGAVEPVCVCRRAGRGREPLRRVQPAVHLRAIRPGQDPLAERDPGGDQKESPGFQHCVCGL